MQFLDEIIVTGVMTGFVTLARGDFGEAGFGGDPDRPQEVRLPVDRRQLQDGFRHPQRDQEHREEPPEDRASVVIDDNVDDDNGPTAWQPARFVLCGDF